MIEVITGAFCLRLPDWGRKADFRKSVWIAGPPFWAAFPVQGYSRVTVPEVWRLNRHAHFGSLDRVPRPDGHAR